MAPDQNTYSIENQITLPAEMFGGSDFWLETKVIIKISKKNDTSYKTQGFFNWKKLFVWFEKKNQNG